MKTKLILTFLSLSSAAAFAPFAAAAAPAKEAACCVEAPPAAPAAASACCAEEKPTAPVGARSLYQLGTKWTDDSGAPVRLVSLHGQPVILAMFFASCEYACPLLVSDIQRVRAALPAELRARTRVVLVSFDTARDTPAALKAYRERLELDANWTLLRGDADSVQELAMLLGVKFKREANGQFAHSNLITLLSPGGEIAHQRAGLQGDVSELTKAVVEISRTK
ncbi:MAG TPA: SCO family protein [Opitutaceae bacterium]|nr:SCO family protein [Opitutaceae bacterium]